jgi:hypothetical protein
MRRFDYCGPQRVQLTDADRTTLAEIGKQLGQQTLEEVATIIKDVLCPVLH